MIILAIESSCDETGVGICELAPTAPSRCWPTKWRRSVDEHARFGGVVPEIASRAHLEALGPDDASGARHRRRDAGPTSSPRPSARAWRARCWSESPAAQGLRGRMGGAVLRRQPSRRPPRRGRLRAWPAAGERRSAGVRRAHQPAARAIARRADRRTREHRRRCRWGGVRQGGPTAGARLSRRQGARRPGPHR